MTAVSTCRLNIYMYIYFNEYRLKHSKVKGWRSFLTCPFSSSIASAISSPVTMQQSFWHIWNVLTLFFFPIDIADFLTSCYLCLLHITVNIDGVLCTALWLSDSVNTKWNIGWHDLRLASKLNKSAICMIYVHESLATIKRKEPFNVYFVICFKINKRIHAVVQCSFLGI